MSHSSTLIVNNCDDHKIGLILSFAQAVPASGLSRPWLWVFALFMVALSSPTVSMAQDTGGARSLPNRGLVQAGQPERVEANEPPTTQSPLPGGLDVDEMLSPTGLSSTLKLMLLLTVLSLAPSILMMTTCFIRFIVVLGLLRQALGTQQLPPNQVLVGICLFLTFLVMAPVWQESYDQGIRPYSQPEPGMPSISMNEAFERTVRPIRRFMSEQIESTGNSDGVWMLLEYQRPDPKTEAGRNYHEPENYDEVPLSVLLPAFMLSELKTAFIIGFQLYLPFIIIDMVISSVLISMGMMMLPPVLISLPFKLLLFVMIDGWFLTVGMMLETVRPGFG